MMDETLSKRFSGHFGIDSVGLRAALVHCGFQGSGFLQTLLLQHFGRRLSEFLLLEFQSLLFGLPETCLRGVHQYLPMDPADQSDWLGFRPCN